MSTLGRFLVVMCLPVLAQSPPAFEVASIKLHPNRPGAQRVFRFTPPSEVPFSIAGNRVTDPVVSLQQLIIGAYHVQDYQIYGLPDWGKRDAFDVEAKTEGETSPTQDQVRLMMQTLLADRLQLKLHHESKELPVYELVIDKSGSKLKAVGPEEAATATTVPKLIGMLSLLVDRPILDKTGLAGTYHEPLLDWAQLARDRRAGADDASTGQSIFTAVQDQLGLKLQPAKAPLDILVIDHVEKPSEN